MNIILFFERVNKYFPCEKLISYVNETQYMYIILRATDLQVRYRYTSAIKFIQILVKIMK